MTNLRAPAPERHEVVRSVVAERQATLALLRRVEPESFDAPATPGWRVREVVAHLITLDRAAVLGTMLPMALGRSTERLERWNDRAVRSWADRPVPSLVVGLETWGRRFARLARTAPRVLYRTPVRSPWGRTPAGLLVWIRAYDEWVHRHDIRRSLSMPDERVDVATVAEFLLNVVAYDTLPKLAGRAGRVAVSFTDTPILPWAYDLASGTGSPDADPRADATISARATPFVMAAAGRDRFDELRATGQIQVEGDEALAEAFLSTLRIV